MLSTPVNVTRRLANNQVLCSDIHSNVLHPHAQYITRLLIKLLPKGVVFSFLLDPQYAEWTMDRHGMGLGLADQGGL